MEWSIPLQKLEVGKIQICEIQHSEKSIVPLAYFDGQNTFPYLNILLPKFKIDIFDAKTGKLDILLEDSQSQAKLSALQVSLLNAIFLQQSVWFPTKNFTLEMLEKLFKPIVENSILHLYFPVQYSNDIHIYKNKVWHTSYEPGLLEKGDTVRILFRIQGLSFHKNSYTKEWTGKYRLQHRIVAILIE